MNRRDITQIDILEWALEAVTHTIGTNTGNPSWDNEIWAFYYDAQRELERRIRISNSLTSLYRRTRVPA
jgi:hypothetical protein